VRGRVGCFVLVPGHAQGRRVMRRVRGATGLLFENCIVDASIFEFFQDCFVMIAGLGVYLVGCG
jgi:hypothetical protein